jgi:hypothetical protein
MIAVADVSRKFAKSPWAVSVTVFAAAMLLISGLWQLLVGFATLVNDTFLVRVGGYVFAFNSTAWGFIHLVLGATFVVVGIFIFQAKPWALWAGVWMAVLNALFNFIWLPASPTWALLLIAVDVLIIWALATTNRS